MVLTRLDVADVRLGGGQVGLGDVDVRLVQCDRLGGDRLGASARRRRAGGRRPPPVDEAVEVVAVVAARSWRRGDDERGARGRPWPVAAGAARAGCPGATPGPEPDVDWSRGPVRRQGRLVLGHLVDGGHEGVVGRSRRRPAPGCRSDRSRRRCRRHRRYRPPGAPTGGGTPSTPRPVVAPGMERGGAHRRGLGQRGAGGRGGLVLLVLVGHQGGLQLGHLGARRRRRGAARAARCRPVGRRALPGAGLRRRARRGDVVVVAAWAGFVGGQGGLRRGQGDLGVDDGRLQRRRVERGHDLTGRHLLADGHVDGADRPGRGEGEVRLLDRGDGAHLGEGRHRGPGRHRRRAVGRPRRAGEEPGDDERRHHDEHHGRRHGTRRTGRPGARTCCSGARGRPDRPRRRARASETAPDGSGTRRRPRRAAGTAAEAAPEAEAAGAGAVGRRRDGQGLRRDGAVLPAVPSARAHWPTTMAAAVAVWVVVKVVVPVRVTVTLDVFLVCGIGLVDGHRRARTRRSPGRRPHRSCRGRRTAAGRGRVPPPGVVPPSPPKPPVAAEAAGPGAAEAAPKPPRLQAPDTGWLMETVVAVIGSPNGAMVEDDVVGLPNAEMQDPTVTAAAVVVVVWRIVVDGRVGHRGLSGLGVLDLEGGAVDGGDGPGGAGQAGRRGRAPVEAGDRRWTSGRRRRRGAAAGGEGEPDHPDRRPRTASRLSRRRPGLRRDARASVVVWWSLCMVASFE